MGKSAVNRRQKFLSDENIILLLLLKSKHETCSLWPRAKQKEVGSSENNTVRGFFESAHSFAQAREIKMIPKGRTLAEKSE